MLQLWFSAAEWATKGVVWKKKEAAGKAIPDRAKMRTAQDREIERRKVRVTFLMEKYGRRWREKMHASE